VRFVVDEMMGRLSRWLRAAGYDVEHRNPWPDEDLLERARATGATILTRDGKIAVRAAAGGTPMRRLEAEALDEQLKDVARAFGLDLLSRAFSRCLECNVAVEPMDREAARAVVPPLAFERHERFERCPRCGKVFWEGTHVERMRRRLRAIAESVSGTSPP
jgi:uncharacterized protein with PIN domain